MPTGFDANGHLAGLDCNNSKIRSASCTHFLAMFAFALWCLVCLHRVDDVHSRFGSRGVVRPGSASDRAQLRWNIPHDNWRRRDESRSATALSARGGGDNRPLATGSPMTASQQEASDLHNILKAARCLLHLGWIASAYLCLGCWWVSLCTHGLVLHVGSKPLLTLIQLALLSHFGESPANAIVESLKRNGRRNLYPDGWLAFLSHRTMMVSLAFMAGTFMVLVWDTFLWILRSNVGRRYIKAAHGIFELGCILGISTNMGAVTMRSASKVPDVDHKSQSLACPLILSLLGGGYAIWVTRATSIFDPPTMPANWFAVLFGYSGYLCVGSSLGSVLLEGLTHCTEAERCTCGVASKETEKIEK
jgi:hypothetical protein